MYLINIHAKPTEESDQFDKVLGAYVSVYIDFKDIDGAFYLVHSMSASSDYLSLEKESAINFRKAINKTNAQHTMSTKA